MSNNTMYQDTQEALGIAIAAKIPVILWGDPGQGKTSVLNAIAEETGRELTTVIASIREPSDFAGLPNIVDNKTCLVAPNWAQKIAANKGQDILFFDEISTAVPATQAAMLRVALDRVVGDLYLGDDVSIVAAANPTEIAADGWDLAAPMANRFIHLEWKLPADVVQEGFFFGWPETPVPKPDQTELEKEIQNARVLVGSFVGRRTELLTVMPKSASEAGRAFPTPRSWEMAATLYGYCKAAKVSDVALRLLIDGTVGGPACLEFLNYVREMDLPDPEEILANPSKWKVPDRGDITFAIGMSLLNAIKQNMTDKRWLAMGEVLSVMVEGKQADIGAGIGFRWMKMRPNPTIMVEGKILKALAPILREAKLISA